MGIDGLVGRQRVVVEGSWKAIIVSRSRLGRFKGSWTC